MSEYQLVSREHASWHFQSFDHVGRPTSGSMEERWACDPSLKDLRAVRVRFGLGWALKGLTNAEALLGILITLTAGSISGSLPVLGPGKPSLDTSVPGGPPEAGGGEGGTAAERALRSPIDRGPLPDPSCVLTCWRGGGIGDGSTWMTLVATGVLSFDGCTPGRLGVWLKAERARWPMLCLIAWAICRGTSKDLRWLWTARRLEGTALSVDMGPV